MRPYKGLLNNQFPPITYCWGFLASPVASAANALADYSRVSSGDVRSIPFRGSLSSLLEELTVKPAEVAHAQAILTTQSSWVAYFGTGWSGIEASHAAHLCGVLKCRGLAVTCAPDGITQEGSPPKTVRRYGAIQLELFADHPTDWLNCERGIWLHKECTRWDFGSTGQVQPFEQTEKYNLKRKTERFTVEMLEQYCAALGIRLFDPDFYGPDGFVIQERGYGEGTWRQLMEQNPPWQSRSPQKPR
jgi:hypothetical protein